MSVPLILFLRLTMLLVMSCPAKYKLRQHSPSSMPLIKKKKKKMLNAGLLKDKQHLESQIFLFGWVK